MCVCEERLNGCGKNWLLFLKFVVIVAQCFSAVTAGLAIVEKDIVALWVNN